MFIKKTQKFYYVLILIFPLFLNGCGTTKSNQVVLSYECAKAGPLVADELEKVCDEIKCKNTISWLNRHAKVCDMTKNRNEK